MQKIEFIDDSENETGGRNLKPVLTQGRKENEACKRYMTQASPRRRNGVLMKKAGPAPIDPEVLIDILSSLNDPRIDRTEKHDLIDILVIAICAAICGAKSWVQIEDFGEAKKEWFKSF